MCEGVCPYLLHSFWCFVYPEAEEATKNELWRSTDVDIVEGGVKNGGLSNNSIVGRHFQVVMEAVQYQFDMRCRSPAFIIIYI